MSPPLITASGGSSCWTPSAVLACEETLTKRGGVIKFLLTHNKINVIANQSSHSYVNYIYEKGPT